MYVSLYRRYRPQRFSDIVGQDSAVSVLQESLKEGRLGHAYLFSGPRGCGKTSAARIVAKSLNCLAPSADHEPCGKCESCVAISEGEHLDVIEIDGASNRGIGEIRDLKTRVNLKPLNAQYKVYIIDEVHMLTEQAFNALLKTLEEPPANVVFLLATTEPNKVPVTIRSRCQHIPFHRISISDIVARISFICEQEHIEAEQEAVWEISRQADGALRDALSLMEQAVALGKGKLTLDGVLQLMGGSSRTELEKWITLLRTDAERSAISLHEMLSRGISMENFTESLFSVFRDLWLFSLWGEKGMGAIEISDAEHEFIKTESAYWNAQQLRSACLCCNKILPRTRYGMRMEVFSGLLLIGLTSLFDRGAGEKKVSPAVANVSEHKIRPRENSVKHDAAVDSSAEQEPPKAAPEIPVFKNVETEKIEREVVAPASVSSLCEDMGNSIYSQLVSHLKDKQLQIASALLDVEIVKKDGGGWGLSFAVPCPAESFLNIPQNYALLSDAVAEMWNLHNNDAETANNSDKTAKQNAVISDNPETKPEASRVNDSERQNAPVSGAQRLLKLMGAEVLYVKDTASDGDADCESEDKR